MNNLDDTALPGELDVEQETLYRRRPRTIEVRRSRFPFRALRALGWLFLAAAVLVPTGYGGFRVLGYTLSSPQFQVSAANDLVIDGNRFVSREEIASALVLPLYWNSEEKASVFRLNLDEERKQVESIPWVKSASVTRVFPHRLVLHIVERVPVAFVNVGGKVKLVDGDGVMLEKPEKADFTFPVLDGFDAPDNLGDRRARLALYGEFMTQVATEAPSSGWLISEVNLADADDLQAVLVQGRETILVHFGRTSFPERFRNFLTLLPELRRTNTTIDSIDLRFRNQVVVNPKTAVTSDK